MKLIDNVIYLCKNREEINLDDFFAGKTTGSNYRMLFNETVKMILNLNNYYNKFSFKYMEDSLESFIDIVINHDSDEDTIKEGFNDFLNNLTKYNIRHRVLIPLIGIEMEIDTYEAGVITLRKGTAQAIEPLLEFCNTIIISLSDTDETKEEMLKYVKNNLNQYYFNNVYAEYSVIAEPKRARELALIETRRMLDILRFSIPFLYPDYNRSRINIAIIGEKSKQIRHILTLAENKETFQTDEQIVGSYYNYILSVDHINILNKIGVPLLFDVMKINNRNEFHKSLLRSIHWYAAHIVDDELENKLLSLITCLEALLNPADNFEIIGNTLAEGAAIICYEDVENRLIIRDKIKKLYSLRSKISHGSEIKEKDDIDITYLSSILKRLLYKVIQNFMHFQKREELFAWIVNQKFS